MNHYKTYNNPNIRRESNRMSMDSGLTHPSILSKELFDGDELLNALKRSSFTRRDSTSKATPPIKFITAEPKRPSALEYDEGSGELLCGKDLEDIFKQPQHSDCDSSMRTSITSSNNRRFSNTYTGSDRRKSMMSMMSLANSSIVDNPVQLQDTVCIMDSMNSKAPSPALNYNVSMQKNSENTFGPYNKFIGNNSSNTHINYIYPATIDIPSTQRVKENERGRFNCNVNIRNTSSQRGDEEEDDRIEHIEKIGPYDIICGRNNGAHNWVGNRRFRITIMMHLKQYTDAPSREERTHVIKSVIELLNKDEVGARFIKKVGVGKYERLKDKQIREKVGHAFRDMMTLEEKGGRQLEDKCFR